MASQADPSAKPRVSLSREGLLRDAVHHADSTKSLNEDAADQLGIGRRRIDRAVSRPQLDAGPLPPTRNTTIEG